MDQSPYGPQFHGLTPVTPAFDAKWQELARTDPGLGQDQHNFVGRSHYTAQVAALQARGLDLSGRGMAVQDALWSTSVQCRDLTPGIFAKGLKEKFGEHYDLAKLSDKDIVDAVQDYKTAHVATLFSKSPKLHESLKDRFADEKVALERLADTDATLAANGVRVEHTNGGPSLPVAHRSMHTSHAAHPDTLRLRDHAEGVQAVQSQLSALGYAGADGRPLHADGRFGTNTQAAVEAFQRDHHLQADGIAGPRTVESLQQAQAAPRIGIDHPDHVSHFPLNSGSIAMRKTLLLALLTIPAAAHGAPDEDTAMCRNGGFPMSTAGFSLAKVTVPRLFFLNDDDGCPAKGEAACGQRAYVLKDDVILLAQRQGGYVCAFYPNKVGGSAGWVAASNVQPLPTAASPNPQAWNGQWHDGDNELQLPSNGDGSVTVNGNAYWPSANPDPQQNPGGPHLGAVIARGYPEGQQLQVEEDTCQVRLHLVGELLVVSDNQECGGANVSFNGVYRRDVTKR